MLVCPFMLHSMSYAGQHSVPALQHSLIQHAPPECVWFTKHCYSIRVPTCVAMRWMRGGVK
jgi:hypothetical protein